MGSEKGSQKIADHFEILTSEKMTATKKLLKPKRPTQWKLTK